MPGRAAIEGSGFLLAHMWRDPDARSASALTIAAIAGKQTSS
jgi:hypothetical protein